MDRNKFDVFYWINTDQNPILVAGGEFNGEVYHPGDTIEKLESYVNPSDGQRISKSTKWPQRKK